MKGAKHRSRGKSETLEAMAMRNLLGPDDSMEMYEPAVLPIDGERDITSPLWGQDPAVPRVLCELAGQKADTRSGRDEHSTVVSPCVAYDDDEDEWDDPDDDEDEEDEDELDDEDDEFDDLDDLDEDEDDLDDLEEEEEEEEEFEDELDDELEDEEELDDDLDEDEDFDDDDEEEDLFFDDDDG